MKLGVKNVAFVMREGTLKDLVAALAKAKGADLEETISAKGGLASGLTVFVNGAAVQDLGTRLMEGDEVVLSSAFDGG
jgi:molybdopterin converting factor small subunit